MLGICLWPIKFLFYVRWTLAHPMPPPDIWHPSRHHNSLNLNTRFQAKSKMESFLNPSSMLWRTIEIFLDPKIELTILGGGGCWHFYVFRWSIICNRRETFHLWPKSHQGNTINEASDAYYAAHNHNVFDHYSISERPIACNYRKAVCRVWVPSVFSRVMFTIIISRCSAHMKTEKWSLHWIEIE